MKAVYYAISAIVIITVCGCSPELAQTPYGDKELHWEAYLKEAYPSWEPPQTLPPTEKPEHVVVEEDTIVAGPDGDMKAFEQEILVDGQPIQQTVGVIEPLPVEDVKSQSYTVEKGDSLWKIANKFYGDGGKWKRIQEANMDKLSNPDKLKVGMKLKIPE